MTVLSIDDVCGHPLRAEFVEAIAGATMTALILRSLGLQGQGVSKDGRTHT
jgi:hypothetical protein